MRRAARRLLGGTLPVTRQHGSQTRAAKKLWKGAIGETTIGDANPNGPANNIAGICSEHLNVPGVMSHPENLIDPVVGETDGRGLFPGLAGDAKVA